MNEKDKKIVEVQNYNKLLLEAFESWLQKSNLSPKTIKQHNSNIEFFAEYLYYYEPVRKLDEAEEKYVSSFLTDWYPRKALWASDNNTKSYIASFKKFFKYLVEKNRTSPNIEAEVRETLKEYKEEFLGS
ncbi:MAG: site-specific integrase [Calothrix sp. FI2-JRJ7]|jgi:site-specific recombinase XerD|nr:site-specific integrase [Calothrix sp. FI2-JRJ7]